ncbi:MAG: carboxypeptidase regulatory-like domain-containing protein [Candidatus Marinimicrobia bacterium]|nr:carboxypeptidase regulatory-like domain-containing protein [Candidatus Neomarinimicrobiota bacterium]
MIGTIFSAEFDGTITNGNSGFPIGEARVALVKWSASNDSLITYVEQYTDENGLFFFPELENGEYRLFIVAENYTIFADFNFLVSVNISSSFQLSPEENDGVECTGRILDDTQENQGIPGTTISRWVDTQNQGYWEIISVSDENGDYTFYAESTVLFVNALGFAPTEFTVTAQNDQIVDIFLEPFSFNGSVNGFIIDNALGRDISAADLTIYSLPADSMNAPTIYHLDSDETGYYSIENIPEGEATIFVNVEGYEGYFSSLTIENNTTHNINLDILPGTGKISGYVQYIDSGEGVSTFTDYTYIEFIPVSNSYHWVRAEIWSDGRYWANLPAGDYIVACFQASSEMIGGERLLNRVHFYPDAETFNVATIITVEDGTSTDEVNFNIPDPIMTLSGDYYSDILNGGLENYLETGLGKIHYLLVTPPPAPEPGDIGDEIGVLDFNGIPDDGECSGMEGQILAGASLIGDGNSTIVIPVFEHINECASSGTVTSGFVEGNAINLMYWDTETQTEIVIEADYFYGSFSPDSGGISNPSLFGNQYTFVNVTSYPNSEQQTMNLDYEGGWNLVGTPLIMEDMHYMSVFPDPVTGTLFAYQANTYIQSEYVEPGLGYWLRFSENRGSGITGLTFDEVNISVIKGWNLISGITETVSVTSVFDPSGLIVPNTVYGFSPEGYENTDSFSAGSGYWILSTGTGTITISENGSGKTQETTWREPKNANWIRINNNPLYFGFELIEEQKQSYRLPPKPPSGAPDVRFKGGWKYSENDAVIEVMNPTENLNIEYHITNNERWILSDIIGNETSLSGDGYIQFNGDNTQFFLNKTIGVPTEFALRQNYPNPFNPITTIMYDVPKESHVTLTVCDLMGRVVRELVSSKKPAGTHHIIWNGTDAHGQPVASGMYLYQLKTGYKTLTKKLVMLK